MFNWLKKLFRTKKEAIDMSPMAKFSVDPRDINAVFYTPTGLSRDAVYAFKSDKCKVQLYADYVSALSDKAKASMREQDEMGHGLYLGTLDWSRLNVDPTANT